MAAITHISVGKTFNIGNYQSIRLEINAELGLQDDDAEIAKELYQRIHEIKKSLDGRYAEASTIANNADKYHPDAVRDAIIYLEAVTAKGVK